MGDKISNATNKVTAFTKDLPLSNPNTPVALNAGEASTLGSGLLGQGKCLLGLLRAGSSREIALE